MTRISIALVSLLATLALATSAGAATPTLIGTVGPGFTITMNKRTVTAGSYVIVIHVRSPIHNFRLTGRGVDKATTLSFVGTVKWTVKLKKGTYSYVCDPHRAIMHGVLKVT